MRLSQGHLNLLSTCPRKFQHTFLEQLGSPTTPEQQERLTWGSRFHLLMQQRELGLPVESLLQEDSQLQSWFTGLVSAAPEILTPNPNNEIFRESEHCRTITLQGYLLTVIYDLFVAEIHQAQILDWKTYPRPQNRRRLEQNWQTRLYLYVLAETSDYLPEKISMTYWFVQSKPEPKSLKFTYNMAQHEQIRRDLSRLLDQLTRWLEGYEKGESFPQVTAGNACDSCQFGVRCWGSSDSAQRIALRANRTPESLELVMTGDWIPNLGKIQEVSL